MEAGLAQTHGQSLADLGESAPTPGRRDSRCLCRSRGWRSLQDTVHSQAQRTLCSNHVSVRDRARLKVRLTPGHPHCPSCFCSLVPSLEQGGG